MLSPVILVAAVLNGLLTGAVYGLVALGLTLIYGVLHIINFAHGALLTAALFAAFFAHRLLGLDPYLAAVVLTPLFFALGYGLQRFVIGPAAHGEDRNILLVTLGLAVVIENALLFVFRSDIGIESQQAVGEERGEHGHGQQRAMGKVDDVQHAVDQREPERDQRVDRAGHQAVEDGRDEDDGREHG